MFTSGYTFHPTQVIKLKTWHLWVVVLLCLARHHYSWHCICIHWLDTHLTRPWNRGETNLTLSLPYLICYYYYIMFTSWIFMSCTAFSLSLSNFLPTVWEVLVVNCYFQKCYWSVLEVFWCFQNIDLFITPAFFIQFAENIFFNFHLLKTAISEFLWNPNK